MDEGLRIPARMEGRVVLRVRINAQGQVVAASVLRSSGFAVLDQAAPQRPGWSFLDECQPRDQEECAAVAPTIAEARI